MSDRNDVSVDVGVSLRRLNQQIARVDADFHRAAQRQERAFLKANQKIAKDFERLKNQANSQLSGIKMPALGIGGALAGFVSTRELVRMTDTWTDLSARVGLAVGEMDKAPEVMSRIAEMARRTYSSLETTAEGWLANATALKELGMSTEESLDYTEALNNAMVVSGAKAQRAASVQDALSKAMALGTLSGQNLNTVIQSGGRVAELLAAELGVGVNQLRRLGQQGAITGQVIDRALRGNLEKLRQEAESMPATIGDSLVLLKNAVLEYVGSGDAGVGASARLAEALILLADNIDLVVVAGGILAGRVLGPTMLAMLAHVGRTARLAAAGIGTMGTAAGATAASLASLRAAMAMLGGPVGMVLATLAALPLLSTSTAERTRAMSGAVKGASEALDEYARMSARAKREQEQLAGGITHATDQMLNQSRAALQASRDELLTSIRDADRGARARDISWQGVYGSDLDRTFSHFARQSDIFGGVFREINDMIAAVRNGDRTLASISARLEQIAGAGQEATNAAAEFRKAISDRRSTDVAVREMLRIAEAIGGFDREIAAVRAAAGTSGAAGAVDDLARALELAAAAGGELRSQEFARDLRQGAQDAKAAGEALEFVEEALNGNIEAARELRDMRNPLQNIEDGARSATTAVMSLKEAMEALPNEIKSTVSGLEGATDSVSASAALLRRFEGFRATPYWDVNAHRVGYGSDTITLSDGTIQRVTQGMRVSVEDANRDLTRRIGEFQNVIRGQIGGGTFDAFNTAQQAALTSIAYNYGSLPDRLVAAIRTGNNDSIVTAIASLQEHNNGINRDRRLAEASIFAGNVGVEGAARRQEAEDARRIQEAERERNDALKSRNDLLEQSRRQVNDAAFEATLIGKTAAEQARLRAEYLLTNDARQRGIALTEKIAGSEMTYGEHIAETARKIGEQAQAHENAANIESRQELLDMAQKQIQDAEFELTLVGKSVAEQARLRTAYTLTNEAKQRGIELTERAAGSEQTYGEKIAETARKAGELAEQQDDVAKAYQRVEERARFYERVQQDLKNGLLDAIVAGKSFSDVLANVAQMLARAALQAALFNEGPMSGGAGRGIMGAIFGGFRASGGPVSPGRSYMVGERGPEMIVPRVPGTVIPNHALQGGQSGVRIELLLSPDVIAQVLQQAGSNASVMIRESVGHFARNGGPQMARGAIANPRRIG